MKNLFLIVVWIFVIASCVHPLEYNEIPQDILVVEGFIDNDYGPHEIQIAFLTTFAGILEGGQKRLLDAKVTIFDELGNAVNLQRETFVSEELIIPGINSLCIPPKCECLEPTRLCRTGCIGRLDITTNYLTPEDFIGVPGRCYSLEVTLDEFGSVYRSDFQMLEEPIQMDSILFEYQEFPAENEYRDRTGVNVYGSWSDSAGDRNFYFFQIGGTYKIETTCIPGFDCLFDPRDKFGEECWVIENRADMSLNLLEDRLVDGQRVIENVGFIEDDGKRFSSNSVPGAKQYYAEVTSYAINEAAYDFYATVGILGEINGEIFDPPPVGPIGNIYSVSNPNEVVVGYFGVFAKSTKGAFINRNIFEERKFHGTCGDCRYFNYNGQLEIPEIYK